MWKKDQKSEISQKDVNIEGIEYVSEGESDTESIHEDEGWQNRREIRIYIGIIDIFQAYNGAKWAESIWKNAGITIGKIFRKTASKIEVNNIIKNNIKILYFLLIMNFFIASFRISTKL